MQLKVSVLHHMYILMVMCKKHKKQNELTSSVPDAV